jgi:CheY-like chemotaxis protein
LAEVEMSDLDLLGCCILLVDDEHIVVRSLSQLLRHWGATILGPAGTVEAALALLRVPGRIDLALIDVNLRGEKGSPVADALVSLGIPFAFTTGYDKAIVPERFRHVTVLQKPYDDTELMNAVATLLSRENPSAFGL